MVVNKFNHFFKINCKISMELKCKERSTIPLKHFRKVVDYFNQNTFM